VGRLADAEGRHGQLDMEEDYEDYEGAEEDPITRKEYRLCNSQRGRETEEE